MSVRESGNREDEQRKGGYRGNVNDDLISREALKPEVKLRLEVRPITLREASEYINANHRHHNATVGCKFAIGCFAGDKMVGCAVCGRPVSRHLDNGLTLEINRVCTDGTRNACSILYGACCRIAKAMGYHKVITYTLRSEPGTSLKASNFADAGIAGGTHWTGKRDRGQQIPYEMKRRWEKVIKES